MIRSFVVSTLAATLLAGCATARPAPPARVAVAPGTVSAADPRATEAGLAMLRAGGSAADAALATMIALTVVEPQSSGIGGGGFLVYHDAKANRLVTFDGRETAPAAARPDRFLKPDGTPMSQGQAVFGGLSVGVPGNVALAAEVHRRYGRLPWARLFEPAIALARGFEVSPRLSIRIAGFTDMLSRTEAGRAAYLPGGAAPAPGSRLSNEALARSFEAIAAKGPAAFYRGDIAISIAEAVAKAPANATSLTPADLAGYRVRPRDPVCGSYRAYRVCGMGPPSSGGIAVLAVLKQLERFDMAALGKDSPVAWHLFGESMRLAYADRARWIGDPDFVSVPTAGLTDPAYLGRRSALIAFDRAMQRVEAGAPAGAPQVGRAPEPVEQGTSHLSVVDRAGNAAALTSTIESGFGSGLVAGGFSLNNELTDFSFVPERNGVPTANRVAAGKRPMSSMAPTIVYGPDGRVAAVIGAAGGGTIPAQVAKSLIGLIDWKLPVDEAIALPQLMVFGDRLVVEKGTWLEGLVPALRDMGHDVGTADFLARGVTILKLNGIARDGEGWRGAADPRSEGVARSE
jgi:gamma-glutamyltranspeptidase/glutathione hydrolase